MLSWEQPSLAASVCVCVELAATHFCFSDYYLQRGGVEGMQCFTL